jgi:hypothetical protein
VAQPVVESPTVVPLTLIGDEPVYVVSTSAWQLQLEVVLFHLRTWLLEQPLPDRLTVVPDTEIGAVPE